MNLRDKLICIMRCEIRTNNRKKIKSARYFYIFMLPNLCLAESSWSFERPGLDLGNKRQRRQAIFAGFQKVI